MRTLLLGCLIAGLLLALLAPAAMATDFRIDDTVNAHWITATGSWTLGTSSSSKFGDSYYYCNQDSLGGNSVTYTPDIPVDNADWEVYIWYSAGIDRATQAECIIHHADGEDIIPINQQQNGGMWVYLGTYEMDSGTSNSIRITNRGSETSKVVVADAVRLYSTGGDQVPPIILNVWSQPGSNSAVITWNTDEPATSQVEYGKTKGYGHYSEVDNALVKNHQVSITGLDPQTLYHFRVKSADGAGNLSISADAEFTTNSVDNQPPLISDIVVVPGANSAVVTWKTDELDPATSQVEYGATDLMGTFTPLDTELVTSHKVVLTGLTVTTRYYFRVKSTDGAGNTSVSVRDVFDTTMADSTPPVISNVRANPDPNSAVITWDTNEYATSQVEYGTTSSYGSITQEDTGLDLNHSVSLSNLEPTTQYYYRVISKDGSDNRAVSGNFTFTTTAADSTAPDMFNLRTNPGSQTCTITWETNEPATTKCRFGLSIELGQESPLDSNLVKEHSVTLTGLAPSTKYFYMVMSSDAHGNYRQVGILSFTTKMLDGTPPAISEVAAEPGSNSVVITWVTDEPTTSQVEYGLTAAYGLSTVCDETLVTNHRVSITGLEPSTTYHYRVKSKDAVNNESVSDDHSFTTAGPDETPPTISGVSVSRNVNSAIIRWLTNEPATSRVEYGTTTSYGTQTPVNPNLVTIHSVTLTGLQATTLYHFRVKSTDGAGNETISGDYTFETSATAPEYRMVWADTWTNGLLSAQETTQLVDTLAAANYNAVVVEVRKAGDAYYLSNCEPWATNISPPAGAYDPLQDLINKAHAKGIEVHAWIVTYRAWHKAFSDPPDGHVYDVHGPDKGLYQDWTMRNTSGGYEEGNSLNIDPGVPGVQNYIVNIVKDIVTKYPQVDGVNFDYVRYPGTAWGYNETTKKRFNDEFGFDPPTSSASPNWGLWCDYRRQQVTDLVKRCFVEAMAINPRIKMSVDSVGWEGPDPNTNYTGTPQYANVFQDARGWMNQHFVDINILMNYKREFDAVQKPSYRRWADWLPRVANASGRLSVDGQGVYLNSISGSITQMRYSRNAGANGLCGFSYATTNKDGQPATDFFNSVRYNLYTTPAPVPDMPWKNEPTTGIIFGTVTDSDQPNDPIYGDWLYKAYVTVRGPVERETYTDATGVYSFIDLPPGVYTVTVSKSGYRVQAFGGLSLSAGQVLRQDASIESGMVTSPPGAVTRGWNLISLPIQPADMDPTAVFAGMQLDGKLQRWDRMSQDLVCYSQSNPSAFGDIRMDEGYWFVSPRNTVISYEPAVVEPYSEYTITLPKAGWHIIGCPFTSPRDWSQVMVTHGLRTVPIASAREWRWLDSVCLYWDNAHASMDAMGLEEDYVTDSMLRPWKGYWFRTYLDNVSITIR